MFKLFPTHLLGKYYGYLSVYIVKNKYRIWPFAKDTIGYYGHRKG